MFVFDFGINDLTTVAGAAVVCVVMTQWLKQGIDSRLTNVLALVVTLLLVETAVIITEGTSPANLLSGFIVALLGASLATFGYELVSNLLGFAGIGDRQERPQP